MDKKFFLLIFFIFIILLINFMFLFNGRSITGRVIDERGFEDPDKVIDDLYRAIKVAEERGKYKCCIKPACTMCYLGHWKSEKGTCFCDDTIAEGKNEDVCPECVSGIEKGLCSSTIEEGCELDPEIFGGE